MRESTVSVCREADFDFDSSREPHLKPRVLVWFPQQQPPFMPAPRYRVRCPGRLLEGWPSTPGPGQQKFGYNSSSQGLYFLPGGCKHFRKICSRSTISVSGIDIPVL